VGSQLEPVGSLVTAAAFPSSDDVALGSGYLAVRLRLNQHWPQLKSDIVIDIAHEPIGDQTLDSVLAVRIGRFPAQLNDDGFIVAILGFGPGD
jgi:hypothetical protein